MRAKRQDLAWLPQSKHYQGVKETLERIQKKLGEGKEVNKDKKENYVRVIRQLNYTMSKTEDKWPAEVDKVIDNMASILNQFEKQLIALSKGSSFFCGSGGSQKQLQNSFKRLAGYQHIFEVIRPFQDKQIRDDIIAIYQQQQNRGSESRSKVKSVKVIEDDPKTVTSLGKDNDAYKNMQSMCELMKAVSVCPNGYIAKKLIRELPDTQWIAGILHEQGTIVDKDLNKAIQYYKQGYRKKNYQALYRLGSLNQRGLYGKPYEYIKMWQQASAQGHLQATTDMGYLYEYGLQDEDNNKVILAPDFDKAYKYYQRAAQKHFPRALNNLATFYFSNEKYRDQKKCLQYLQQAAEAQYVKSLHNLGLIYYQGKLVKQDNDKARVLIKRAAQKGDIQGRILYVQMMLNEVQRCNQDTLVQLNKYCREIIAKDQENPEAYYFLGIMYEQGYGVPKQPQIAFLYYTISAGMKHEGAILKLGECYKVGFGVEPDLNKAVTYLKQVAQSNKEALIPLGQIYEKGGDDLNPNFQRAFDCYYEACNYGFPQAYIHLGNMYKYGRHVKANQTKAEEYFQKAKNMQRQSIKKLNSSSSDLIQSSYYRRK